MAARRRSGPRRRAPRARGVARAVRCGAGAGSLLGARSRSSRCSTRTRSTGGPRSSSSGSRSCAPRSRRRRVIMHRIVSGERLRLGRPSPCSCCSPTSRSSRCRSPGPSRRPDTLRATFEAAKMVVVFVVIQNALDGPAPAAHLPARRGARLARPGARRRSTSGAPATRSSRGSAPTGVGLYADPNRLAMSLIAVMPVRALRRRSPPAVAERSSSRRSLAAQLAAIVLTHSRSGAVAAALAVVLVLFRGRQLRPRQEARRSRAPSRSACSRSPRLVLGAEPHHRRLRDRRLGGGARERLEGARGHRRGAAAHGRRRRRVPRGVGPLRAARRRRPPLRRAQRPPRDRGRSRRHRLRVLRAFVAPAPRAALARGARPARGARGARRLRARSRATS